MQRLPEFVRDDEPREGRVKLAVAASLTGWETVVFQVVEEPAEGSAGGAPAGSDSATAAFAP
jgi:hypothetical protein